MLLSLPPHTPSAAVWLLALHSRLFPLRLVYLNRHIIGGRELEQTYSPPGKSDRECKYSWFDGWDWMLNRALACSGRPRIVTGPGELAFDPHIHTLFSHCSISQPIRLIREAVRLGLGAIAVMDHNDIRGALDATMCAQYLKSRGEIPEDFLVVPGVEVNSTIGHVGALFVTENLPMPLAPTDLVKAIHDVGGIAVAVHPYHSTGIGDAIFDAPFDAVEIECGSVFGRGLIQRNRELLRDPRLAGVAKIGSSDAHYTRAMASCYTLVRGMSHPTLDSLKQAILTGDCEPRASKPYERVSRLLGSIHKLG